MSRRGGRGRGGEGGRRGGEGGRCLGEGRVGSGRGRRRGIVGIFRVGCCF